MITSTLKGVFPEPKPAYKRNFIKENVSRIKQMQGLVPLSDPELQRKRKDDRFKNVPPKSNTHSHVAIQTRTRTKTNLKAVPESASSPTNDNLGLDQRTRDSDISKIQAERHKFLSRGMQTERLDDISKLYETGVIKYPSAKKSPKRDSRRLFPDQGDHPNLTEEIFQAMDKLDLGDRVEHNFVKENARNIKPKIMKNESCRNPIQLPANYQIGVVPKYLKDRKYAERTAVPAAECPPGHVLLPDVERQETLRVLKQSYTDRVHELNSLPVRSDTLRMKKRKMEIEEELKKIDEGIKVFQRPKVFVKIHA